MKKKVVKTVSYWVVFVGALLLVILQLKTNKAENQAKLELAKKKAVYIPVKTEEVRLSTNQQLINDGGYLKAHTDLRVLSETQGKIVNIYKQGGDFVKKGDVIAKVDDQVIKSQLQLAKANYEQMQKDKDRFEKLKGQNAVTQKQYEEIYLGLAKAKSNLIIVQRQLDDTEIKSPVSGKINRDFIEVGMFIAGGTPICEVIDNSLLKIQINLPETDIIKLNKNHKVVIRTSLYPGKEFYGKVVNVAGKANEGNKFPVEIELPNTSDNKLKAGMYVQVILECSGATEQVFVPRSAIKGTLKDASVFVVENDMAYNLPVKVGQVYGDNVEIVEGLSAGQHIVTSGVINLDHKRMVKIIK